MDDTRRSRAACVGTGPVQNWTNLSQACTLISFWLSRSNSKSIRFLTYRPKDKYAHVSLSFLRGSSDLAQLDGHSVSHGQYTHIF